MNSDYDILTILADGRFHSGEEIAAVSGITRAAVWNRIQKIKAGYNLEIHAVTGRGYRIPNGIDALNKSVIEELLQESGSEPARLDIFHSIDSTNQYLLDQLDNHKTGVHCCLAEMQTHGRGRRGRHWLSPYAKSIYLSFAVWLNLPMYQISGLSLVVGVGVAQTLDKLGIVNVGLKWPNDLHINEKKIGGILVELQGEAEGPVRVVIGLGVNVQLPLSIKQQIDQPVTDLADNTTELPLRNLICATLIKQLESKLGRFEAEGLSPFIEEWKQFDVYLGKQVSLSSAAGSVEGIYQGIGESGELLLQTPDGVLSFNAGEVSLRKS